MNDETQREPTSPEGQNRFATLQDDARTSGVSAPPPLTEESGTPRFSKGHAPAEHRASTHRLTEEEREERSNSDSGDDRSRGTTETMPEA